jgi:hypothetical protein
MDADIHSASGHVEKWHSAVRYPLGFYDVAFSTLNKAYDGFTILSGKTKVIQRAVEVAEERLPVLFVDAHALVRGFHAASQYKT